MKKIIKMKLSDYVAEFLADNGIKDVFTVTGGGAMHLNDSFGHSTRLTCTYNHHEQASAMAAECYARIHNQMALVCVTTGPGGTNAMTGVVGGYLDSIPMLIISGQVRYDTTARSTGLNLRAMGDQEFDIVKSVQSMTKYSEMVIDPRQIKYCLMKALHMAQNGRPGPCWLDIPTDVQAAIIETEDLPTYDVAEYAPSLPRPVSKDIVQLIIDKIKNAKRPVLNAGNGIRISGGYEVFRKVAEKLGIPIVTNFSSVDLIETDHPLYCGRCGGMGDRPGNFAIQNSDLILSIGSRLSIRQVSYNYASWAREAYVIAVDIDPEELKKPISHIELPIFADAKNVLETLDEMLSEDVLFKGDQWVSQCQQWKMKYPVVLPKFYEETDYANPYCFLKEVSQRLPDGQVTVGSNGTACVASNQCYVIGKDQRFILNSAIASMGYGLPAAIGACIAVGRKSTICLEGDGSLQMNLQELQTVIQYQLPIKLFVFNNRGYHSIRITQTSFFGEPLVGIGDDSHDLSFPSLEKLASAYGFPYHCCKTNEDYKTVIDTVLASDGPVICEIITSTSYAFEPKSTAKRLPDGKIVSAPLEDLFPFLPEEEVAENMYIPLWKE